MDRQQLLATLDWQVALGADEAIGAQPADWAAFAQPDWWRQARSGRPALPAAELIVRPHSGDASAAPTDSRSFFQPTLATPSGPSLLTQPAEVSVAAQSLEALAAEWQASDHCGLKRTALNFVFGDGNPATKIMLIGEGPGADEDKQGKPFVGKSGQLLGRMLAAIGLNSRADYYVTNVTPWRPPGNRTPTDAEVSVLRPYLVRHIELVQPQVIVTLGGLATKALLERPDGITRLRGKFLEFTTDRLAPTKLLPLFHPSALLRNSANKKQSWQDLLTLKAYLAEHKLLPERV